MKFFKPTPLKLIIASMLSFWVYFYSLGVFSNPEMVEMLRLVREGMGIIEWGSSVLMKASYGTLWLIVTVIVFMVMILFDRFYVSLHNVFAKRRYINRQAEAGELVLKKAESAIRHERFLVYWLLVVVLLYACLFYLSGFAADWSILATESLVTLLPPEFSSYRYLVFLIPFWYLISCGIVLLIDVEKKEETEEKLKIDHDAVENSF